MYVIVATVYKACKNSLSMYILIELFIKSKTVNFHLEKT